MNPPDAASSLRWWEHPLLVVAWSVVVMVVYALFPTSDTAALIALLAWGVGVFVWMLASDAASRSDARAIWKDVTHRG